MITLTEFILLSLATFRITHLFVYDSIFSSIKAPLYTEVVVDEEVYLSPKNKLGEMLSCHWCTSVWVSLFLFLLFIYVPIISSPFITVFAISGVACLCQMVKSRD